MMMRWVLLVGLLVLTAGALVFRVPRLCDRPFHGDEAIHAWKFGELWNTGRYEYDPFEYHGPTLNYFTLPVMWMTGQDYISADEAYYRMVPVIFGVGLILLLWLAREDLGYCETMVAAVLVAISPAMVYYSRYYIQEMLLVFFTFGAIIGAWRYVKSGRGGWALLSGVCFGLMHATKETWVIAAAAMGGAAVVTMLWAYIRDGQRPSLAGVLRWRPLVAAVLLGAGVAGVFLSGFFSHIQGPVDSIRTYTTYLSRGTGNTDHVHPWDYYFRLLIYTKYGRVLFTEGLIVGLAVVGGLAALVARRGMRLSPTASQPAAVAMTTAGTTTTGTGTVSSDSVPPEGGGAVEGESDDAQPAAHDISDPLRWRRWFWVFLASYTVLLTAAYSVIPYKTPWCVLGFLHGMILLAGIGAVALIRWAPHWSLKTIVALLLMAAATQLAWQAHRANHDKRFIASRYNPWVYSHPGLTFFDLVQRLEALAAVSPDGHGMLVKVFTKDIWPLPWYVRHFTRIGYWAEIPDDADAAVVICSAEQEAELQQKLKAKYRPDYYGLRPTVVVPLYVRSDLWEKFLETRPK